MRLLILQVAVSLSFGYSHTLHGVYILVVLVVLQRRRLRGIRVNTRNPVHVDNACSSRYGRFVFGERRLSSDQCPRTVAAQMCS